MKYENYENIFFNFTLFSYFKLQYSLDIFSHSVLASSFINASENFISSLSPLLEQGQIFSHVISVHLDLISLLSNELDLSAHLPHLILAELAGTVWVALQMFALVLGELLGECGVLLLQVAHFLDEACKTVVELLQLLLLIAAYAEELLVDAISQGEVHFFIGEARNRWSLSTGPDPECPRGHRDRSRAQVTGRVRGVRGHSG